MTERPSCNVSDQGSAVSDPLVEREGDRPRLPVPTMSIPPSPKNPPEDKMSRI